jgi:hypothetical protein
MRTGVDCITVPTRSPADPAPDPAAARIIFPIPEVNKSGSRIFKPRDGRIRGPEYKTRYQYRRELLFSGGNSLGDFSGQLFRMWLAAAFFVVSLIMTKEG